jgi:hypothetical protein
MTAGTKWPEEHEAFFRTVYIDGNKRIAIVKMINDRFGTAYTLFAIKGKAKTLGIKREFDYVAGQAIRKWSEDDFARLKAGRKLGQTYAAIARQLGDKFTHKAVAAMGFKLGLTSEALGLPPKWRPSNYQPTRVNPVVVSEPILPIIDEIPTEEPILAAPGPDGIIPDTMRNIRRWCLWAGFSTDGTDVDTRVNRARRLHNRAPVIVWELAA